MLATRLETIGRMRPANIGSGRQPVTFAGATIMAMQKTIVAAATPQAAPSIPIQ